MALRNYKSYTYYDENGNAHDSLIGSDIKGMYVYDLKVLDSAPINRRICGCGHVDAPTYDNVDMPCPRCGNTSFLRPSGYHSFWDRKKPTRAFNVDNVFIANDTVCYRTYLVEFLTTSKEIKVVETQSSCVRLQQLNNVSEYLNYSFPDDISRDRIFEKVLEMMQSNLTMQLAITLCENNKGDDKNAVLNGHGAWDVFSLYNMFTIAPFTQNLEYDVISKFKETWFEKLNKTDIKMYYSILDIEAREKSSVVMRDMIPVIGIVPNTKHLDSLNKGMIAALKYAIMHRYIDRKDVRNLFDSNDSTINKINAWGPAFTDFFRRNIVLYGTEIVKAYEHLRMTGASNMKEDSLIRLEAYLEKKNFKDNQIRKFEEEFLNGDPIAAMKALIS